MIREEKMVLFLMIGRIQNLKSITHKIGRFDLNENCFVSTFFNSYGFIHDQRLPNDHGRSVREQKQLDKEMSRLDKWLKMISGSNKWFPEGAKYHEKMNERVWKVNGPPKKFIY